MSSGTDVAKRDVFNTENHLVFRNIINKLKVQVTIISYQGVDVLFAVVLTLVYVGKLDEFLEICCILSWVQFLTFFFGFLGDRSSRTREMSLNEPRLRPAADI